MPIRAASGLTRGAAQGRINLDHGLPSTGARPVKALWRGGRAGLLREGRRACRTLQIGDGMSPCRRLESAATAAVALETSHNRTRRHVWPGMPTGDLQQLPR